MVIKAKKESTSNILNQKPIERVSSFNYLRTSDVKEQWGLSQEIMRNLFTSYRIKDQNSVMYSTSFFMPWKNGQ